MGRNRKRDGAAWASIKGLLCNNRGMGVVEIILILLGLIILMLILKAIV